MDPSSSPVHLPCDCENLRKRGRVAISDQESTSDNFEILVSSLLIFKKMICYSCCASVVSDYLFGSFALLVSVIIHALKLFGCCLLTFGHVILLITVNIHALKFVWCFLISF